MTGESAQRRLDVLLDALASVQHGVVAWWQLDAAGVPRDAVDMRIARGALHRVHRGVYAVGHRALSREGHLMAAVLALGPTAVLSHRSAAEHLGLLAPWPSARVHVTVRESGGRRTRRGCRIHRVPEAPATVHEGIPTTTVAWTLLDLAATSPAPVLARAVEAAERARVFDLHEIAPLLETARPGVRALRAAIDGYDDAPTRSEFERRFLALCHASGVPRPVTNGVVEGGEVDFHWPAERLIVEADSLAFHDGRAAMERDRRRDAALALAGWHTQRLTWRQVTREAVAIARLVLHLLAERRPATPFPVV